MNAVTTDTVAWADLPDREEAGSPNVLGAIALAAATSALTEIGLDHIAAHERTDLGTPSSAWPRCPGLRIHGPTHTSTAKLGVIHSPSTRSTTPDRRSPRLRAWCRRAQRMLLRPSTSPTSSASTKPPRWPGSTGAAAVTNAGRRAWSGSASAVTTTGDVDLTVAALEQIVAGDFTARHRPTSTARYHPAGHIEPTLYSLDSP